VNSKTIQQVAFLLHSKGTAATFCYTFIHTNS
jgi:hypothetical protein